MTPPESGNDARQRAEAVIAKWTEKPGAIRALMPILVEALEQYATEAVRAEREAICALLLNGKQMKADGFWVASEAVNAIRAKDGRAT